MKTTYKNLFIECPCCHEMRGGNHLHHLEKWRKQYGFVYDKWRLENPEISNLFWVCDKCIKNGKAIHANPKKQNSGAFSLPFFAFYDRTKECIDCKETFVFTKEEQQFWYEELRFIIFSQCIRCKTCRRKHRNPLLKRISHLIPKLDLKNLDQVEDLIKLYLEAGKPEKAKYYLAMARKANKNASRDEKISSLKEIISGFERK